jgi:hypothetical protein
MQLCSPSYDQAPAWQTKKAGNRSEEQINHQCQDIERSAEEIRRTAQKRHCAYYHFIEVSPLCRRVYVPKDTHVFANGRYVETRNQAMHFWGLKFINHLHLYYIKMLQMNTMFKIYTPSV